ncbi:hypothetical protein HYW82_02885 [Candidatus Peregrinibacteria bacterium]|nr:hypothetical protein [Candidatus Peregrinibacteria bacterium]
MISRLYNRELETVRDTGTTALFVVSKLDCITLDHPFIKQVVKGRVNDIWQKIKDDTVRFEEIEAAYYPLRAQLEKVEGVLSLHGNGPFQIPPELPANFIHLHESIKALMANDATKKLVAKHVSGVILGKSGEIPSSIRNSVYFLVWAILEGIDAGRLSAEDFDTAVRIMADRKLEVATEIRDIVSDARESVSAGVLIQLHPTQTSVYVRNP